MEGFIIGELKSGKVIIARKNAKAKTQESSQQPSDLQQQQQDNNFSLSSNNNASASSDNANDFLADANHMSWGFELLSFAIKQYKHNPNSIVKQQECRVFNHDKRRLMVCTVLGAAIVFIAVGNEATHNELARTYFFYIRWYHQLN